jgi:uncharacterized protein YjbI with pentapeptide repeats
VLLHFALLADKVSAFQSQLQAQVHDHETQMRIRLQLPNNIFIQLLAGTDRTRAGIMGCLLHLIAWVTLVLGPVALLVFFQLQFLPYHSEPITWWQRLVVVADILVLWLLWPAVMLGKPITDAWHTLRMRTIAAAILASLIPLLLVFTIATFPGEWLDKNPIFLPLIPTTQVIRSLGKTGWITPKRLLVAGDVDLRYRKPTSLWSNRLVLPGIDVVDHTKFNSEAKFEAVSETVSLRSRNLQGAVLIDAVLRKADFIAARLEGAWLTRANLKDAKFGCAFSGLDKPNDPETSIDSATDCGQLQGASLDLAQLQGAWLRGTQLQGASLQSAGLQGATLTDAKLQGARLDRALLQGASLDNAQLQGASLDDAQLQGASLEGAQLQGASLDRAQLQGALLDGALLKYASLRFVYFWRADARKATATGARISGAGPCWADPRCGWSDSDFIRLKQNIIQEVPKGPSRTKALARIQNRLDPFKPLNGEEAIVLIWADFSSRKTQEYDKGLAEQWVAIGCAKEGTPYVLPRMLERIDSAFTEQSQQRLRLAELFLEDKHCDGARTLLPGLKA